MMSDRLRPRALPLTVLAVGFGLVLAGCGGDEGEPAGQDAEQDEAAEQEGAEDAAEEESDDEADQDTAGDAFARAEIADAIGNEMGQVTFTETEEGVRVQAELQDLTEGFRGFHIHENGVCEPQSADDDGEVGDFLSAGGHLSGEEEDDLGVVEGEESPEGEGLDEEEAPEGEPQSEADVEAGADHPGHAGDLPNLMVAQDGTAQLTVVTDRLTPELLTEGDGTAVIIHSGADNHGNVPERYAPAGPDADTLATGDAGERAACGVIEDS